MITQQACRAVLPDKINTLTRVGAITDNIAETVDLCDPLLLNIHQDSLKGLKVAMNVADDGSQGSWLRTRTIASGENAEPEVLFSLRHLDAAGHGKLRAPLKMRKTGVKNGIGHISSVDQNRSRRQSPAVPPSVSEPASPDSDFDRLFQVFQAGDTVV